MIKGSISFNKLAGIIRERKKLLVEEIPHNMMLGDFDDARTNIKICEELQRIWIKVLKLKD